MIRSQVFVVCSADGTPCLVKTDRKEAVRYAGHLTDHRPKRAPFFVLTYDLAEKEGFHRG